MARFFSREFIELMVAAYNADEQSRHQARALNGVVVVRCYDRPDGQDVTARYTFEAGRCARFELEEASCGGALREQAFVPLKDGLVRITASYPMFVALDRGEVEPAEALNSADYRIEGPMLLLLPLLPAVNAWSAKARELPKEY